MSMRQPPMGPAETAAAWGRPVKAGRPCAAGFRLCRWFTLEDVPLLEDDVDAMRLLFHADGEGVPKASVTAITAGLDELLTVLALDTPTLAANFRQVLTGLATEAEQAGK